jgi:hypothetical protein
VTQSLFPVGDPLPPKPQGEEGGSPDDFAVTEELRAVDEAASLVHDYIWGKNGVTKEQANDAIWKIHNTLRPLFEVADLGY